MDAYASISIPFTGYASDGSKLRADSLLLSAGHDTQASNPSSAVSSGVVHTSRKKSSLKHLYVDNDPSMSIGQYMKKRVASMKSISETRPRFLLEMHWTERNFEDKVCRIHNACVRPDGTILAHKWMHSQEVHLRECGVYNVQYMRSESDFKADGVNGIIDLFGVRPTRYHIPHFLTDILPMIYASEILRPTFTRPSEIKSVCEAPGRRRCSKSTIEEKLYPSIFADERIAPMDLVSWVPQLSAILPGRPSMHFSETMFNKSDHPVCFRSIVAFNQYKYFREGPQWYGDSNPMFSSHGISRASARVKVDNPKNTRRKGCKRKITVLNRVGWVKRGDYILGRDVVNVEQVVDQIEQISRFKGNENLDLSVSIEYFENMSFPEQVAVMQNTDVFLGVHGAGLANILFARQDVPILEVLPFAYYAGPFNALAHALYLDYSNMIAEPDTKNFKECLETRAERFGDPDMVKTGMKLWNDAVRKRSEGEWYSLLTHKFTQPELVPMKLCARAQRLRVNAIETGRRLVEMAQNTCKKVKYPGRG